MNMLQLLKALYVKLTAVQTAGSFYDDLGGRIRLMSAKQDETTPHCVIKPMEFTSDNYFDGEGDDAIMTVNITLYGDKETATQPFPPESLIAINDKLIALIDRVEITATGYNRVQIWGDSLGTPDVAGDAWVITSMWKIKATPS